MSRGSSLRCLSFFCLQVPKRGKDGGYNVEEKGPGSQPMKGWEEEGSAGLYILLSLPLVSRLVESELIVSE